LTEVFFDNLDGAKRTVILGSPSCRSAAVYRFFNGHTVTGGGIAYRTSENLAPTTTKINVEFSVIVFVKREQWAIKWVLRSLGGANHVGRQRKPVATHRPGTAAPALPSGRIA
jgi:hypothetical protein